MEHIYGYIYIFYSDKNCTKAIISKYGILSPMIRVRSLYFGAHGSFDYNANLLINVAKAIFQEKRDTIPGFILDDSEDELRETPCPRPSN